jgi:hypothetical protein
VSLLVASALLGGCMAREAPAATPSATAAAGAAASGAGAPRGAAGLRGLLADGEAQALLRRAVCWLDEPGRARTCLPPSAEALEAIAALGRSGDARMVFPLADLLWVDVGWGDEVRAALTRLTGEALPDARAWSDFAATRMRAPAPPDYAAWKAGLLALTAKPEQAPGFAQLFEPLGADEELAGMLARLVWTGVQPNESRPLADPPHVERERQRYLAEGDVVYGVVAGGEARAYPKRIVAWHGVVHDTLGGTPLLLAHCLPCGGASVWRRASVEQRFGTAGLAFAGRALLFEEGSYALWDALGGTHLGLAVSGLIPRPSALAPVPLFVTTWADWSARHPETTVLTLETGVVRDYASGAAVRDELALREPRFTARAGPGLGAKEPVLGVVAGTAARAYPLALLARRRLVQEEVGRRSVVVLCEGPGLAAAAYEVGGRRFTAVEGSGREFFAVDERGDRWAMREHALVHTVHGEELPALPRLQAWWFAWWGLHPDSTVLE